MSSHSNGAAHAKPVRFSEEFLDELRAKTPMASLVGRRVRLTSSGKHHKGCCPFHDDKNPSLAVYSDHFHCFACQARGDAIDFVTRTEDVTFQDAVAKLASDAGLSMPGAGVNGSSARSETKSKAEAGPAGDWRPIVPPPPDAPIPSDRDLRCDKLHTYRGTKGELLLYVRRIEARGSKSKLFLPLTYGILDGRTGWHGKALDAFRPLYGLDKLAARPDAPVMVCEGEKSADAAQWLFPDMVCVAWSGGAGAVAKADWTPLTGRRTDKIIWPDNDAPGRRAAAEVAALLPGARTLRVDDLLDGADAADVQPDDPEAWLQDRLEPASPGSKSAGPADQWPGLDLDLATASAAPAPALSLTDVFPASVAAWIGTAADAAGAPPDYVAGALLAAAGGCIGNARWGQPKEGWAEPPVVNVALVGRPSAGKSPALDQLVNPLHAIAAELNADWSDRRRRHATDKAGAEERQKMWRAEVKGAAERRCAPPMLPADAEDPEPPHKHRLVSTDPTVAKAERMSAGNPRGLLLVRDELAGWVAGMDRFGAGGSGADRAFWLQAYGGRPWSPDRVKDGDAEVSVPHLTWAVMGGIQPDRLASLLLAGDDDGFAARFLYVWPEALPPRWTEAGGGLGQGKAWLARLRALPWTPPEPLLLPFTRAAQAALHDWRVQVASMEESATGLFLSWLGKLPGFAVRLAVILAHLAWAPDADVVALPEVIVEADVLRAVTFLNEYAVPMARRAFGEAGLPEAERNARRLARWLLRQRPRPATLNVRALRRMANGPGIADAERLTAALQELAALGWVRAMPDREGERGGRPRNDWAVNPAIVEGHDAMA